MHYTEGDGAFDDPVAGHKVFKDEDPPVSEATQLRHEEANTYQEEIANVIIHAGMSLNGGAESIAQMIQLRQAIVTLITNAVAAEASIRSAADVAISAVIAALKASDIDNDSGISGANVKNALDTIDANLTTLFSNDVTLNGLISTNTADIATNVADIAAHAILIQANTDAITPNSAHRVNVTNPHLVKASQAENDSTVSGAKISNALDWLKTQLTSPSYDYITDAVTMGFPGVSSGVSASLLVNTSGWGAGWTAMDARDVIIMQRYDTFWKGDTPTARSNSTQFKAIVDAPSFLAICIGAPGSGGPSYAPNAGQKFVMRRFPTTLP